MSIIVFKDKANKDKYSLAMTVSYDNFISNVSVPIIK